MEIFFFIFVFLILIMLGMLFGVILMNKCIKGSCGGLNVIVDVDQCFVCNKEIDLNSLLCECLVCLCVCKMMECVGLDVDGV